MTTITAAAAAAAGRGRRLLDSTARLFQTSTDSSFSLSQPGSFVLAKAVGSQVIELADEKTGEQ